MKTLTAGLLTQKLLHLLHAHVNVDTRAVVVVVVVVDACGAAGVVSQAAGPFQQQEEEEAPEPPQHRVWPTSGLRRAARAVNQPQHSSGRLARSCSSLFANFFLIRI